ncbi:hypothetical protein BOTBODRAFT_123066 [Botryobasidium botryosum FD-172 SS1]|uniref:Translation initiation factor eIF2B subunit gamma n=1 Tax=Botryobasidium botryosum (strain FD-172 SS1) TaxID=930990 RepID=A0A067NB91_BOTB1|nr:hypothetical protein BOTBODRAFT_123066 [Botryobasidium botryosum FD-172 SS1]
MLYPSDGPSTRKPEFQAVILAGVGSNLEPLTNPHGDKATPKALLPIGNKPMITHVLTWLEEASIKDVLLIVPSSHRQQISHHINSDVSSVSFSSLKIDLETADDEDFTAFGTADILKKFHGKIKSDVIVLPCDFIPPPSLPLSKLLNAYRMDTDQPILTALVYERGATTKEGPGSLIVGIDEKTNTLMYVDAQDDKDEVDIRLSLMYKSPSTRITSRYLDSHVYIFRRTVLDLLAIRPTLSSLKEDVIPFLCKIQYQNKKRIRWGPVLNPQPNPQSLALAHSTTHAHPNFSPSAPEPKLDAADSMPPSHMASPQLKPRTFELENFSAFAVPSSFRCGVVVHRIQYGYAARANTHGTYLELNRQVLLRFLVLCVPLLTGCQALIEGQYIPSSTIDPKAQISTDSIVGQSTRVAERTSIKKSVVGAHCTIGKNVRISGCVIMDHVAIGDGAKLENCVLSAGTQIGERSQLKDCESEPGYEVKSDASLKGERLEI